MRVLLKFKDAVIKEIPLEQEVYTIGRKADNDIVIDNLAVSGFHAKLVKEGETVYLEDQNSTNGSPITEATIKVRVGGIEELCASEGDGPVNALDRALRKAHRPRG